MKLLWASLLVLLPLVAEIANAQKCSGEPEAPEHATIRCFKKRGTCRAMCQAGYIFQGKGAKSAIFTCVGGQWEMKDGHEDRCSPVCKPPCQNGGRCDYPNQCTCYPEWEGRACEIPVCDPPCANGECVEPNTCDCEEGFTGDACDEEEYDEGDYGYTTEDPMGYDDNEEAYAYDDNEDAYEDEDHTEDYEDEEEPEAEAEDEEIEVVEAEVHEAAAEPEYEDEPEAEAEPENEDEPEAEAEPENEDEDEAEPTAEAEPEDEDEDQGGDDENVGEDENGGGDDVDADDDDDDEDNDPQTGASTSGNGVIEVVPQILVGSAALLMVRGW